MDTYHYSKQSLIKMQSCGAQSSVFIYKTVLQPKTKGSLWRRWWKYCRSPSIRKIAVRLLYCCLLVVSEESPMKSFQQDWTEQGQQQQPTHKKNFKQLRNSHLLEITYQLVIHLQMVSPENINARNIMKIKEIICKGKYTIYIHICIWQ